jgi:hypothetical protein
MRDLSAAPVQGPESSPHEPTLIRVILFLRRAFRTIAAFGFIIAAILGSLALYPAIERSSVPRESWFSWGLVSAGSALSLYGLAYGTILQGFNQIALLRRWEAIFGIGTVLATLIAVLIRPTLTTVVTVWQGMGFLGFLRNRWLCSRVPVVRLAESSKGAPPDPELWGTVWPLAWRSGVTNVGSQGLIQASGVAYSLLPNPQHLAGYLLALRLSQLLVQICGVPFQSKVPHLARLRGGGHVREQLEVAQRAMRRAYASMVIGATSVALLVNPFLALGGRAVRVQPEVWWLFSLAVFFQLYGGMLSGLYLLSNRVFGHIAVLIFGMAYLGSALVLTPRFGAMGLSGALVVGCLAGSAYAAGKTYPALGVRPWHFEKTVAIPPLIAVTILIGIAWLFRH